MLWLLVFNQQSEINNQQLVLRRSSGKRQQGNVPRLLDGRSQPVLMRRTYAGQTPGHNLAALGHKLAEPFKRKRSMTLNAPQNFPKRSRISRA
jgi:hypothetical protein